MVAAGILDLLIFMTVASSIGVIAVLAIRGTVRRVAGARLAYMTWLLAPAVIIGCLVPARMIAPALEAPPSIATSASAIAAPASAAWDAGALPAAAGARAGPGIDWPEVLVFIWIAGALASLVFLIARQVMAIRALGSLTPISGGLFRSSRAATGPAVVGLLSPRIVLPADFEASFGPRERDVVIAHERAHLRGRHTAVRLIAELGVCLNWFNPLAYVAARAIAMDQELVCDEAVAAQHPNDRKIYAETLLKTQIGPHAPLGCYWPPKSSDALKQRIARLAMPAPASAPRYTGLLAIALLACGGGFTAWAARPPVAAPINSREPDQRPDQAIAPGSAPNTVYLRGKVERIVFGETSYVLYVREENHATDAYAVASSTDQLWALSPTNYFGDEDNRRTLRDTLQDSEIHAFGVQTGDASCKPTCNLKTLELFRRPATDTYANGFLSLPGQVMLDAIMDENAPLELKGSVVRLDDSVESASPHGVLWVEAKRGGPSVKAGDMWRIVGIPTAVLRSRFWQGAEVAVSGFQLKDKSCESACVLIAKQIL